MIKIPLEQVLQPGQEYISKYEAKHPDSIVAYKHNKDTITCFEKADLIGFEPEQVIKSIMLYDMKGKFYCFVSPEIGTKNKPLKFNDKTIKTLFSQNI